MLFFVYLILLLLARDHLERFVLKLAPDEARGNVRHALDSVRDVAGSYVWGQGILIAVLFGVYAAGFSLAGLEYAFVVAAVGATFSLVPYLGNVAAAVLVVAVASLSGDFADVILICLGTMAVAQVVESYILQPLIVGGEVGLHPPRHRHRGHLHERHLGPARGHPLDPDRRGRPPGAISRAARGALGVLARGAGGGGLRGVLYGPGGP